MGFKDVHISSITQDGKTIHTKNHLSEEAFKNKQQKIENFYTLIIQDCKALSKEGEFEMQITPDHEVYRDLFKDQIVLKGVRKILVERDKLKMNYLKPIHFIIPGTRKCFEQEESLKIKW